MLETMLLPVPPKPAVHRYRRIWLLLMAVLMFAGFGGGNSLAAPFPNYVGNSPVVKMGCNHELVTLNSHYALLILAIPM